MNYVLGIVVSGFILSSATGFAESISIPKSGLALWLTAEDVTVANGNVTQIQDRSGQNNHARLMESVKKNNPIVVKHEQCGRPVLRFDGSVTGYSFEAITNIRSVFWVVSKNPAAFKQKWGELFVLAGKDNCDFHPGRHFLDTIIGNLASPNLNQGKLWFNGFPSDPVLTEHSSNKLAVISMVAAGDVRADQIATDRILPKRWWNGDIAEIIVYTAALTDQDRQVVEAYLLKKFSITPFRPVVITPEAIAESVEINKRFDANRRKK